MRTLSDALAWIGRSRTASGAISRLCVRYGRPTSLCRAFKIYCTFWPNLNGEAFGSYLTSRFLDPLDMPDELFAHFAQIDDDPEELMRGLAANFRLVDTHGKFDWKDKVILGFWTVTKHLLPPTLSKSHSGQAKFIPLCNIYFPGFPIVSIGFSPLYFRQFLDVPNTAFNFLTASARSFSGRRLIQDIQTHQRSLFFWTVNDEKNMDWCIRRKADGVVTDDIPKFLKTCETYHERKEPQWSLGGLTGLVVFNFWVLLFGLMFTRRYGSSVTKTMDTKKNR